MTFHILTLFPEMFEGILGSSILKKAQEKKLIKINFVNPRDFAQNSHKTVDDKPYGGGKGMILKVDVMAKALESIEPKPFTILLSATGEKYDQKKARMLSEKKSLAIVCGHYEGIDARVEEFVDEVISIGDFVLTGGEIAAMAIIDSITRLVPGVIRAESLRSESFSQTTQLPNYPTTNLLEYPQYTRPEEFKGLKVPKILLSGNHQQIQTWKQKEALKRTRKFRPDLLKRRK